MTAAQLADFRRRTGGSIAPAVPVKELPKFAEMLEVFATSDERKSALKKLDGKSEEWRKALGFSIT